MMDVLTGWGSGIVAVLVGWALTVEMHRRQIARERHLFATALGKSGRRIAWVLGTGMLLSLVPSLTFAWTSPLSLSLLWLWAAVTLGMAWLNYALAQPLRVLLLLYVLSLAVGALEHLPWTWSARALAWLTPFVSTPTSGWWTAAGTVLFVQGLAYVLLPSFLYSPYLTRTQRGGVESGYRLTSWLTLFAVFPTPQGWSFAPLFIPWHETYPGRLPQDVARKKGAVYILEGSAVGGLIVMTKLFHLEAMVHRPLATCIMLVLSEIVRTVGDRLLVKSGRAFAPAKEGLTILAVVPGTPAARLGFLPGEIVTQVNGKKVSTITEYYRALQESPAFTRFQGLDRAGEIVLRQGSRYEGDHHLYGLIFAPRRSEVFWPKEGNLIQSLKKQRKMPRQEHHQKHHPKDSKSETSVLSAYEEM